MRASAVLILVAACGASTGSEKLHLTFAADEPAEQLAHASQSGDVQTIRKLLGPDVVVGGLWFADVDCEREFAAPGEVGGGRLDELARCLATLKLQKSPQHVLLDDVALLSYAPGLELEARMRQTDQGTWLSWIGYAGVLDASDRLPTLTQEAFEALRDGTPTPPAVQGEQAAWLRVCIDASGHVTNAHVRAATSLQAGRMFATAAQAWHFHPFSPAGQPLPACALVLMKSGAHGPGRPPTVATPSGEPMVFFSLHRIESGGGPRLSASGRRKLHEHNIHTLVTAVRFCVNDKGQVYGARLLRSSGIPDFDRARLQTTEAERYEPYLDEGRPVAVCTIDLLQSSF